jgi:glucosamine-6-phosphate deaminase
MNLLRFDSLAAWTRGAVAWWRDRLRLNPRLRMCLAGGLTPNPIYGGMIEAVKREEVSFSEAQIFLLDEYGGLAEGDPGRCASQVRRGLLDHVDAPLFRFLNPDAVDLDLVCAHYEAAIGDGFDLVLLGVGLNGHLGMNEPGSSPDSLTRRVELTPASVAASARYFSHHQLPTWGLTVGMKQLLASKEVWILAAGQAKAPIVQRIVSGPSDSSVPASLMQAHPNCSLFLDPAAGGVGGSAKP